jgi:type I restriction enzyme S subunit
MYLPKVRFKDFHGEWPLFKLSELSEIYDGTHTTPNYQKSGIPFYSVEQLTGDDFSKTKFISKEVFEKENKRVKLERGDVLMTRIGDIGTAKYIDWDVQASFYVSLSLIKAKKIDGLFLSQYINSAIFQKELHQRSIHVAFPKKINLGEIGECHVRMPENAEQKKIALFLSLLDKKISVLVQRYKHFIQYKKGISQKLFNQDIRFKDRNKKDFPEWKQRRLEEVAICLDNRRRPVNEAERASMIGDIPYWGANNVMGYVNDYLFDETIVLLAEDGGNFKEFSSKPIANLSKGKCWVNNHAHVLIGNSLCTTEFLYYSLAHKDITAYVSGGTRAKLTQGEMLKIPIITPSIEEQEKIVQFFTCLDKKIRTIDAQIELIKKYKQGLLQLMLI